ncbi:pilus assembly protein [Bradyrhizobium sp. ISRA443]|uniref:TadE family protein n=1 Tax=unclassified Bradyrhizobium TaxID=2631580 RepID=UPI002478B920|nr:MULTISPECIES: TadE/TadG family type IV pilus assembly protein [unclassified Bradyrhizobium]WGR97458.1 pilus assembly protein [Bradyrhizobium sp. ISRA436]WGS04346.1 pilus assembly protein [Bradyrhizobium sp. ISRA437]WGS11230.1 pilus assembly protein [Bradyrhizobium sp. ISRA443]
MMRKLDQRGTAAMEFCFVAVFLFTVMFVIFDLGRYAITMQSLRTLANAGARQNMIQCYTPAVVANTSPSGCTADYLSTTQKQDAAPFLYNAGLTPSMNTTSGASALTVTASLPDFTMIMPIWGTTLNAPSASTKIPF